jgi:hypothetical protein
MGVLDHLREQDLFVDSNFRQITNTNETLEGNNSKANSKLRNDLRGKPIMVIDHDERRRLVTDSHNEEAPLLSEEEEEEDEEDRPKHAAK